MRAFRRVSAAAIVCAACHSDTGVTDAAPPTEASTAVTDTGLADIVTTAPADAMDAMDATAVPDATVPAATWLAPFVPGVRDAVPAHFLWGSATAPYQIESGLTDVTDWGQWERAGHIVNGDRADDGPDSYTRWQDDIATLTMQTSSDESPQNAYRFGIEWARLFPTRTQWETCRAARPLALAARNAACRAAADPAGLAYYTDLIAGLRAAHVTPLATLQHFTLPTYIDDTTQDWMHQGWMNASIVDDLALYAGFVSGAFGDRIDWWVTINEPLVVATVGYLDGRNPPGQRFQLTAILTVVDNMIRAHAAMYDAIHAADTTVADGVSPIPVAAAYVSIAHHVRKFFAETPGLADDEAAAVKGDYLFNRLFIEAIVNGNLDVNGNGRIDAGEPSADPSLAHHADYFGLNYYSLEAMHGSRTIPLLGGLPVDDTMQRGLPKTDYGWDIYPQGFLDSLVWAGGYHLPVVVTENGIADATDVNRPRFLAEHLAAMGAAIHQGVNVVGYFHWATIDNFEWVAGYCPHFGLYSVDRTDPSRTRTARPSASIYRRIIHAGRVDDALLASQHAYTSATTFCPSLATGDAGR